jgi:hypothetical protein
MVEFTEPDTEHHYNAYHYPADGNERLGVPAMKFCDGPRGSGRHERVQLLQGQPLRAQRLPPAGGAEGRVGFDGFVMSDFIWGVKDMVGAATGGCDIEMCVTQYYGDKLVAAVH